MSERTGILYSDKGEFITLHDQPNIFRKIFRHDIEKVIYKILLKKQDEIIARSIGIVNIIQITDEFVDLELLNTGIDIRHYISDNEIQNEMMNVKSYLQSLGIMYIDWKYDNMGISKIDGKVKLFDFDVSGYASLDKSIWTIEPLHYYSYNKAIDAGITHPIDIDNFAFKHMYN